MPCRISTAAASLFICLILFSQNSYSLDKSVFIISAQDYGHIQAYKINSNSVTLQAELAMPYEETFGAVALAVWPEKELLFATYDFSPKIGWISTRTLAKRGDFDTGIPASWLDNKPGLRLVVETGKEKINNLLA
jgi:hypothetical protein